MDALIQWAQLPNRDVEGRDEQWSAQVRTIARHALVSLAWCCTRARRHTTEDVLQRLFATDAVNAFIASIRVGSGVSGSKRKGDGDGDEEEEEEEEEEESQDDGKHDASTDSREQSDEFALLPEGEILRRALWACASWLMLRRRGARSGFVRRGGLLSLVKASHTDECVCVSVCLCVIKRHSHTHTRTHTHTHAHSHSHTRTPTHSLCLLMQIAAGDGLTTECYRYVRACLSHLLGVMGEDLDVRISVLRAHALHADNVAETFEALAREIEAGESLSSIANDSANKVQD